MTPNRWDMGRDRIARAFRTLAERTGTPPWHVVLVTMACILYFALTVTGATTSSIGAAHLSESGRESPMHWGGLQMVRSDEYNVGTPLQLSMLATGSDPTLSPLGEEASLVHRYPVGPVQTIVFWDALLLKAGPFLPDAQLFAAHWWLPSLLVLLCMPTWFVLMGANRALGWLAGILVVLAPSNFWWTMQPTQQVAFVLAGCTALLAAGRRLDHGQRIIPALQILLGGICIAGMPSNYLLWSLLLGGGVLLATSVRAVSLWTRGRVVALVGTGIVAAALGAGVIFEGRAGLTALTSTIYPGARLSGAEPLDTGQLFGAPVLSSLNRGDPALSNASELSSAFSVAFVAIPFAWLMSGRRVLGRARSGEVALAAWGAIWLLWGMVTLGDLGQALPILKNVPPTRAAQSIGVIGVIALGLALSHVEGSTPIDRRSQGRGVPILAALACGLITVRAGSVLRAGALPTMDLTMLWSAGIIVAIAMLLLLLRPRQRGLPRQSGIALASIGALLVVLTASPLQFGLGGLRGGTTMDSLQEQGRVARADGTLWVTDDSTADVAMLAAGVPALSGFQRSGPVPDQWRRLDTSRDFEESWNRAGGYSTFAFEMGVSTRVETDGFDFVRTVIDPCVLIEDVPEVSHMLTRADLSGASCLHQTGTLRWNGETLHVYQTAGAR